MKQSEHMTIYGINVWNLDKAGRSPWFWLFDSGHYCFEPWKNGIFFLLGPFFSCTDIKTRQAILNSLN